MQQSDDEQPAAGGGDAGENPPRGVSLPLGGGAAGVPGAPGVPGVPGAPAAPAGGGPAFGPDHTPYQAIGGDERVRELVDRFYDVMAADERFAVILALHPADLAESRQKLYEFLSGWLGGPSLYMQRRGHPRLRMRHAPFPIGERERDQWLDCMAAAMDAMAIDGDLRVFLDQRFAHVADFMRNQPG
jgi:hemoglobin